MKKLFPILMSLMMVISFAACGGNDTEAGADVSADNEADVESEVTTDVTVADVFMEGYEVYIGTWNLCGGFFGGEEITEQADLDAVLSELYGGQFDFVVDENCGVQMIISGTAVAGEFGIMDDGTFAFQFVDADGVEQIFYVELAEANDGTMVMTLTSPDDMENFFYFSKSA